MRDGISTPSHGSADSESFAIAPRGTPRNGIDAILLSLMTVVIIAVGYGLPLGIAYLVTQDFDRAFAVVAIWAFVLALTLTCLVWGLRIDERGIRFRRLLGRPRLIEWSRLKEVREVTRWEALVKATFVPWRAWNMSFTTDHFYRIAWDSGYYLFPPDDVHLFRQAIHRWRPDLMPLVDPEPPGARRPESRETGNPYQSPQSDALNRRRDSESEGEI
jgi:hypothetical protein